MANLIVVCPDQCSFHPDKIGPGLTAVLLQMRQNGAGAPTMSRRASEILDRPVRVATMSRHVKHYKEPSDTPGGIIDPSKKLADLDILDLVIQRGAANSANWKPSIKDTIEAMKLKMQMTGNSAFDDLIALFDGQAIDEAVDEAEEALRSADEAAQDLSDDSEDDEPLAEPLI